MKAGLGSYAFRYAIGHNSVRADKGMDLKRLVEFCKNQHIEVLQICDNVPLHQLSENELMEGLDLSEKYGIELELGTTGYTFDHLGKYIEFSHYFNSGILRTVLNAGNDKREDVVHQIKRTIPLLENRGIILAIENHFDFTPFELRLLIEDFNHPLVRICLDPLNSITRLWGINETFNELKDYIITAHIKDVKVERKGTGFLISGCPLGEGLMGVGNYVKQIYMANPGCNIFLEQWMDSSDTIEKTLDEEEKLVTEGMIYLNHIISAI